MLDQTPSETELISWKKCFDKKIHILPLGEGGGSPLSLINRLLIGPYCLPVLPYLVVPTATAEQLHCMQY
jgi:hypothetical protein